MAKKPIGKVFTDKDWPEVSPELISLVELIHKMCEASHDAGYELGFALGEQSRRRKKPRKRITVSTRRRSRSMSAVKKPERYGAPKHAKGDLYRKPRRPQS